MPILLGTGVSGAGLVLEVAKHTSLKLGAGLSQATASRSMSVLGCMALPSSPDSDAVTLNGNRLSFFGLSSVMTMDSIFDQQVGKVDATWCGLCSSVDHVQTYGERKWTMVGTVL